jgi:hypothetical protein
MEETRVEEAPVQIGEISNGVDSGRGGRGGGRLGVLVSAPENEAACGGTNGRRTVPVIELMPFRLKPDGSRLVDVSFRPGLPLGCKRRGSTNGYSGSVAE